MPDPSEAAPAKQKPRRRRRWLLGAVGALILLLVVGGFTLTRSPVLIRLVEPRLQDALGAEVQVRAASFDGPRAILLHDVRATARGVDGQAGEVLTVARLRARIDWIALLSGGFGIREVTFEQPGLRLSQSRTDGTLNLAALTPKAGSTGPVQLPRVRLRGATVEFGEHDGAHFDRLASIEVDGELRRSRATPGHYEISLVESPASAAARAPSNPVPIALTGEYDPIAVEGSLTLTNVDLASWGPAAAPADVRDLWTQLALSGQVDRTEFIYSDAQGVQARFTFDHVGLALPIAADPQADLEMNPGPRAEPARYMRLSDASGEATLGENGVRAEITGLIEDLPYRVVVKSDTLALDAPFEMRFETTEPFSIAERPQLLPFAPTIVRERFQSFSGPTAMLEASVVVTRGAPTPEGPAPIRIAGDLILTEGEAAYASFPYTFYDMTGRVRFDEESIHIDEITGVAPSGATLLAKGVIAPPVHGAEVVIDILIDNVPLDDAFNEAMPASRADLLGTLFNKPAEKRLRDQGLLTEEFSLGGVGSLDIHVRRPLGEDSIWDWDATLSLPRAGLLVEQFPYPAIAEDVVVYVWSDRAEVVIPTIRGLGGGDGDLKARITLEKDGESVFSPMLMVSALGTPIDERLLNALPERDGDEGAFAPARILRELALQGTVDTIARVLPRDDSEEIGFDVSLEFANLTAAPRSAEDPTPIVSGLRGRMQITEQGIVIPGMEGRISESEFALAGDLGYSDESGGVTHLTLDARGLRIDEPFERLLAPFAPEGAAMIRRGIASVEGAGAVDASVQITRARDADSFAATTDLTAFDRLSFNALGARASLEDSTGGLAVVVGADGERFARFDGFSAGIRFDGSEMARVALRGDLDLRALTASDDPENDPDPPSSTLEAGATLAWPSAVSDAILDRAAPSRSDQVRAFLDRWGARLNADLSAVIESSPAGFSIGEVSAAPTEITLNRDGVENAFKVDSGRLVYRDERVAIETLTLTSDKVSATMSGEAVVGPNPSVDLSITGTIAPFDAQARALLPENLRRILDDAGLEAVRIDIDSAQIAVSTETILQASMRYNELALDLGGASIADAHGSLEIRIDTADPRPLDATLAFDHARVQRIELERGVARVVAVDDGATLIVPSFEASAYGGRIFGVARLERSGGSIMGGAGASQSPLRYEVEGALSGLSFDGLRADLRVNESSDDATREPASNRGGVVDATISVAGVVGSPGDRVGQGAVRIWGGELLRLPLAGPLIELSNLQLPTSEQIDFAQAKFYMEGGVVSFEELGVSSQSVNLDGQGTLLWPSLELDLSVTSRGVRRAPILSDVLEAFRNELIVSRVTGPLSKPQFTVQTLPSTQRFLDSIFGSRNDRPEPARPAARPIGDAASPPDDQ
jgi:hypothetical protein